MCVRVSVRVCGGCMVSVCVCEYVSVGGYGGCVPWSYSSLSLSTHTYLRWRYDLK